MSHTPPSGALPPGTRVKVGEYDVIIERFLSEGGYAHVYLVRSSSPIPPGSANSLHVLKRVAVPDKETLKGVRREVDVMKLLRGHRNIVNFIEATASELENHAGYQVFILMEYAAGGGIIDMMNSRLQNRLTESEILKVFSDVVEAVAHMHSQTPPLIHRDLKVENILLASPTVYKLCDFGSTTTQLPRPPHSAAEIQSVEIDLNKHTTLQYRAPEMCDVWARKPIGPPADIWALGVLLYKLCFYTTPFENQGVLAIQSAQYRIPSHPAYSNAIKELIASMLREASSHRPTIRQLHERVCRLRGIQAKPAILSMDMRAPELPKRPEPTALSPEIISTSSSGFSPLTNSNQLSAIVPMRRGRPTKITAPQPDDTSAPSKSVQLVADSAGFSDSFAPSLLSRTGSARAVSTDVAASTYPVAASTVSLLEGLGSRASSSQSRVQPFADLFASSASGPPILTVTNSPRTGEDIATVKSSVSQAIPTKDVAINKLSAKAGGTTADSGASTPAERYPPPISLVQTADLRTSRSTQTSPTLLDNWYRSGKAGPLPPADPSPSSVTSKRVSLVLGPVDDRKVATLNNGLCENSVSARSMSAPGTEGQTSSTVPPLVSLSPLIMSTKVEISENGTTSDSTSDDDEGPEEAEHYKRQGRNGLTVRQAISSSDSEATAREEGASFDLQRALASIQRFAPGAMDSPAASLKSPTNIPLKPKPFPVLHAPVAQSPQPRAAISSLVSRYDKMGASVVTRPPTKRTSTSTLAAFKRNHIATSPQMERSVCATKQTSPIAAKREDTSPPSSPEQAYEGVAKRLAQWQALSGG